MELDAYTLARGRQAVRQAAQGFLFDPNVTLIDFGFPETNGQIRDQELSIRIHVRQKLYGLEMESAAASGKTREVPPTIGGFPTDVSEGIYQAHQLGGSSPTPRQRDKHCAPMCGGISISSEIYNAYGTLGGLVKDRQTGEEMILSNWHVLYGNWSVQPGNRIYQIYQPGRLDGGGPQDAVAELRRHAMWSNLDAAVAALDKKIDRSLVNDQFELGPVKGVTKPTMGMQVVKSGRRTGQTTGRVTGIGGVTTMTYDGVECIIRDIMTIVPDPAWEEEVSGPGDSGSWWLEATSRYAVGLHFAGSNAPEQALGLDMVAVLDALQVDVVTEVSLATLQARIQQPVYA